MKWTLRMTRMVLALHEVDQAKRGMVAGRAMWWYRCLCCNKKKEHTNTNTPKVCPECVSHAKMLKAG